MQLKWNGNGIWEERKARERRGREVSEMNMANGLSICEAFTCVLFYYDVCFLTVDE